MVKDEQTYMIPLTFIKKDLNGDIANISNANITQLVENKNVYLQKKAQKVTDKLHGNPDDKKSTKNPKSNKPKTDKTKDAAKSSTKKGPVKNKEKYLPKKLKRQQQAP
jgi:hypothetical protein